MKLLFDTNSPDWLFDYVENLLEEDHGAGYSMLLPYFKDNLERHGIGVGKILLQNAAKWFTQRATARSNSALTLIECRHRMNENRLEFEFEDTAELTMTILKN